MAPFNLVFVAHISGGKTISYPTWRRRGQHIAVINLIFMDPWIVIWLS